MSLGRLAETDCHRAADHLAVTQSKTILARKWYVSPVDGKRYYMADGEAAYQIMRFLSLGITNVDIRKIPVGEL